MADTKPSSKTDAALKARIITHMNKDHASSLRYFLQHYSSLPASTASTAVLTDISLSRLTLSTASKSPIYLPIRPSPMASLTEARERLVYMSNECLRALGLSKTVVTTYRLPGVTGLSIIAGVALGLWSFAARENLARGSLVRSYILRDYAPLADFLQAYHVLGFALIVGIHAIECWQMHFTRLRKHQVAAFSALWWCWMGTCFLEGFGTFARFDAVVREVEAKAKKH